jgi:phytoene desaturase
MNRKRTAAVVGSGFGGLALAIRLQSAGIATTIFETRDKPGGRAYVYEDQGFTFDAGPTVITDPSAFEELWKLSGGDMAGDVTLVPVTPFYRLCWEDGVRFDYANDQNELDRQIEKLNPADLVGYRRFLAYSQELLEEGYVKLGAAPFLQVGSMLRAAPQLIRLEAWKSVYAKVSEYIQNEHLRQAFSFHSLLVGGNPFETSSIYALIHALERRWGVWFPIGGTGALVKGMVALFERLGGRIRLNAPVDEIVVENSRVTGIRMRDGSLENFDMAASNGDVVATYERLLRNDARGPREAARLKTKRFSMSLFVIYFGLKRTHPELRHHMVLFGSRYRELIRDIFHGHTLPDDFSLYLHAPTRTDPSLAPPGCDAFYVLSPVPHLGHAPIDWKIEAPRYRDRILGYLEDHYIPNLREDLASVHTFSPQDFADQLDARHGSAFSLEPILTQSAYFRAHNRDSRISNLYLVGAGTHPGAGLPGVVASAKATSALMIAQRS